jgi:hypothetical protein
MALADRLSQTALQGWMLCHIQPGKRCGFKE